MEGKAAAQRPLFWAAVAYGTGILAGTWCWRPALWWLVAAAIFMLGAICFRGPRPWRATLAWTFALTSMVSVGAWSAQVHRRPSLPDISRFADGQLVTVTGHVARDGAVRGSGFHQRQTLDVQIEAIERDGAQTPVSAGLRLSLFGPTDQAEQSSADSPDEAAEQRGQQIAPAEPPELPRALAYGQRLRFPVKLRQPHNFQNPGAWDFVDYLHRQGIVVNGAVAAKKVELLPGQAGSLAGHALSRIRRSLLARIHAIWANPSASEGDDNPSAEAGLLAAILLGARTYLTAPANAAWQRTGLYHILVIDGLKVGIFAYFVFWILRRLRAGDGLATAGTIVLSAGYAWLTELGTPAVRSVLMLSIYLLSRWLYRERSLLNAIGAAALVLLAADPEALFDASFQLSFLSVVAIAALSAPLVERTSLPYHRGLRWLSSPAADISQSPRVAQFRRLLAERLARLAPGPPERTRPVAREGLRLLCAAAFSLYEVAVISAVLQLALILPMAFYFHRATIVGVPANAIAVPLTGVLVTAAAIALALSYVWLPLAVLPAKIASWALATISATARLFDGFRVADVRLPTPTATATVAGIAALIAAMLLIRKRGPLAAAGLLFLVGVGTWLSLPIAHPRIHPGVLEVTSIDVGQAESTLLVTPDGSTLLVDAAGALGPFQSNFDFGEDVVAPYLWERGFTRLDALVLTHAHSDHMGGMPGIIADFYPRQFWLGPNAPIPALARVLEIARSHHVDVKLRHAGEQFEFGGARFEVLAPPPGWQVKAKVRNDDSLVLRVSYGATSVLLTGDAEKRSERYLATLKPQATLLKLGHDGSRTSTIPEFLAAVHPSFAFISVGAQNSFGHPSLEVLQRVGAAHVMTYRTDTEGALTFLLDGKHVAARPSVLQPSVIQ